MAEVLLPAASRPRYGRSRRSGSPTDLCLRLSELFVVLYVIVGFGAYRLGTSATLALALLGCGCLAIAPRRSIVGMPIDLWLVVMLVWLVASYTWSTNIYQTKYLLRTEVLLTIGAVGVAGILPLHRFQRALLRGVYVTMAITVFALLTKPTARAQYTVLGTEDLAGWHGYFIHKNALTAFLTVALATVLAFEANVRRRRWAVVVATVLVIGASSGTGLSAFLVIAALSFWMGRYQKEPALRRATFMVLSLLLFVVGAVLVFATLPVIVNLYGKDLTFTGRTQIWTATLWAIGREWFTGFGRGGVWTNGGTYPTDEIISRIGFTAGHAHNAYLEVLLETGVVGLALYVGLMLSALKAAWRRFDDETAVARWGVLCVGGVFMFSLSEAVVFGIWFVLFAWIYVLARRRHGGDEEYATMPPGYRSVTAALAASKVSR